MEIDRRGERPFHKRFKKYRPKVEKVIDVLVKRFCANCLRAYHIVRGFKFKLSACEKCPVFEAITSIDPRFKRIKVELEELKKRREAVENVRSP